MKTNTSNNTKHILWALVGALSLAAAGGVAHADAAFDVPARTVRYSDLDLNTQAGAAALYNRIRSAAGQVCGNVDSRRLEQAAAAKACVDHAVSASVASVNNAKLSSEYSARAGGATKQISLASIR
jgi:UrcA family protein